MRELLTREDFHLFQDNSVDFLLDRKDAALFLDMGLGKTVICLAALLDLYNNLEINRVLIVGPLRVVRNVWVNETNKWDFLKDQFTFSKIYGGLEQRLEGIEQDAQIYLINYENYRWLIEHTIGLPGKRRRENKKPVQFPFDVVIFDELTKMKTVGAKRYRANKRVVHDKGIRHWGLTGSPAAKHLSDVFGQYYTLDGGRRLGTAFGVFQKRYFYKEDYMGYKWGVKPGGRKAIVKKIKDMTMRLRAADYIDMPEVIVNDIWIDLPPKARAQYDELQAKLFLALKSGDVDAATKAALIMKCRQFANGAVFVDDGTDRKKSAKKPWEEVHTAKLDAFDDIMEEANGNPVLGIHSFIHDRSRLQAKYKCPKLGSGTTEKEEEEILASWSNGFIDLLLGHPQSMGYGLDGLQDSGNIVAFFSVDYNREDYDQVIARLARQGQKKTVMVHRILARDTIDEAIVLALEEKAETQEDFLNAVTAYMYQKAA